MSEHYLNYWGNVLPKCPHCKTDFQVWHDDNPQALDYEDGGKTTFECVACRKEFVAVTRLEYTFSTAISGEAADEEEWGPQEPCPSDELAGGEAATVSDDR